MTTYLLAFNAEYAARTAGKTLASGGFDFETVTTPQGISAHQGVSLRFIAEDPLPYIQRIFGKNFNTNIAQLYREGSDGCFVLVAN